MNPNGLAVAGLSSGSYGVYGRSDGTTLGAGVFGEQLNTSAGANNTHGVRGRHAGGGTGVSGEANSGTGVRATSNSGKGVYGQSSSSDGVHGHSTSGVGLRGTSQGFVGLIGISDSSIGLYGYTVAPNTPAFYAEHLGSSGRIAGRFNGDVQVMGNFTVSGGAKNAAVTMPDGSEAVMYCQEAPEPYFEDFGRAQLANGVARVQLEREFASIVRLEDYMIFAMPEGDTKGLYISRKDVGGFEVRELQGGTSNLPFTYRIVAKRKDIEGKRLARLDPSVKQNIGRMKAEAAQKSRGRPQGMAAGESPVVPYEPVVPVVPPPPDREERR